MTESALRRWVQQYEVDHGPNPSGALTTEEKTENAFFRYKSIIGDRLRARHSKAQDAEALIARNILNRMTEIGRPASFAIGP